MAGFVGETWDPDRRPGGERQPTVREELRRVVGAVPLPLFFALGLLLGISLAVAATRTRGPKKAVHAATTTDAAHTLVVEGPPEASDRLTFEPVGKRSHRHRSARR